MTHVALAILLIYLLQWLSLVQQTAQVHTLCDIFHFIGSDYQVLSNMFAARKEGRGKNALSSSKFMCLSLSLVPVKSMLRKEGIFL
jgi:hypothetical protein